MKKEKRKLLQRRQTEINKAIDAFDAVPGIEKKIFSQLIRAIGGLDLTKDGRIKPTIKNLKKVNRINLEDTIFTDAYIRTISRYLKGFDTTAKLTDKYYADS